VIAEPTIGVTLSFPMGSASLPTSDTHSDDSSIASSTSNSNTVKILVRSTTPQDLLSDLGKPSCIFYKEEDKMRIHSVIQESSLDKAKSGSESDDLEALSDSENVVSDENAVDKGTSSFGKRVSLQSSDLTICFFHE
jgi:hypothetical protein